MRSCTTDTEMSWTKKKQNKSYMEAYGKLPYSFLLWLYELYPYRKQNPSVSRTSSTAVSSVSRTPLTDTFSTKMFA